MRGGDGGDGGWGFVRDSISGYLKKRGWLRGRRRRALGGIVQVKVGRSGKGNMAENLAGESWREEVKKHAKTLVRLEGMGVWGERMMRNCQSGRRTAVNGSNGGVVGGKWEEEEE